MICEMIAGAIVQTHIILTVFQIMQLVAFGKGHQACKVAVLCVHLQQSLA